MSSTDESVAWINPSRAPDWYATRLVMGVLPPSPLSESEARELGWRPVHAESTVTALRARIAELEAENRVMCERVERLEADAARYRWLRENNAYSIHERLFADCPMNKFNDAMLDAAIDAALRSARKETE